MVSLVAEQGSRVHRLQQLCYVGSLFAEHRLSSCDAWAQPPHGMRDPHGPGIKPVSSALGSPCFLISHMLHQRIIWGAGFQNRHSLAMYLLNIAQDKLATIVRQESYRWTLLSPGLNLQINLSGTGNSGGLVPASYTFPTLMASNAYYFHIDLSPFLLRLPSKVQEKLARVGIILVLTTVFVRLL